MSVHDRSGLDDFNPMFDSPPTSKAHEQSTHGNGFGSTSGFSDFTQSSTNNVQTPTATASTVNDNSDWDAIFAGLDAPTTEVPKADGSQTNGKTSEPERPQIGRALTEAGVHDDPILKNLTGMGYPRNDALAALEKYDYNLERVSDASPK